MKPHDAWDNARHWPVAHRTQRDADLPDGEFREDVKPKHWFFLSLLFAVFVLGGAISDFLTYFGV